MSELLEQIEKNPILEDLAPEKQKIITDSAIRRTVKKGEFLAYYGDTWPYLFLVLSGSLNAVKESLEGKRLIILNLKKGDFFWGLTFFDDSLMMPVGFEASENSTVALWERDILLPLLIESGETMWKFCQLMVSRMNQASDIVEGLAFQPVASRLAKLIVGHFGEAINQPVSRDLTLDEMAAMIGTSREHVCRLLYRFANENLIEITRTEFVVKNPRKLQDISEG